MTDWQPIETAPKDRTEILLICAKAKDRECAWADGKQEVGKWKKEYHFWNAFNETYWPPTHWMPLPSPPENKP